MRTDFSVSSHQWMRKDFEKDLKFIWDECAWKFQNTTGRSNWEEYATNIQNHGNLGSLYPKYKFGVEGDTPSFLHLTPNGLSDPDSLNQVSWGGYFEWGISLDSMTYAFTNNQGYANEVCSKYENHFYSATFNNFAARMDWAKDGTGNRNPVVIINNDKGIKIMTIKPRQDTEVMLDASGSYDPDDDQLTFKWWILSEAGTYTQDVTVSNSNSNLAIVYIPADSAGKTFHLICEVNDNGTPNLTSYRRIIFEPID